MLPFGLSKPVIIIVMVAGIVLASYVKGRKDVREAWDIERAAQAVAVAQAAARESERARKWQEALTVAGVKYGEQIQANSVRARSELERLRLSAANSDGMRVSPTPTDCPSQTGGATRAELVGFGETIVELVERANQDRAALEASIAAWPK